MNKKIFEMPLIEVISFDDVVTTGVSGYDTEILFPWGNESGQEGPIE